MLGDDVRAGDHRLPRRRTNARGENADGGRLAGAIGAEQAEELAFMNRQVERVDGANA